MDKLSINWITEGHIDFEYKKYLLLAYLQHVSRYFNETKLYPELNDLVSHYHNLTSIKENKETVSNSFPKEMTRADLEKFTLEYKRLVEEDSLIEEIESIVNYALPQVKKHLDEGSAIYEYVAERMHLEPVGLHSLRNEEGYLLIPRYSAKMTHVYEYALSVFESANEQYRGIKTTYVTSYQFGPGLSYESIKVELIKSLPKLPNPATFVLESELDFPMKETTLPVAKRLLVRELTRG